jgi:transcription initiation factor TFIID subunit 12
MAGTTSQTGGLEKDFSNLIKTEELQKVNFLEDATKSKYTVIFKQIWQMLHEKPADSPEYQNAHEKLTEWSKKLRAMAQQHRIRQQQAAQLKQQPQGSSQQQTPSTSQPATSAAGTQSNQTAGPQGIQRPQQASQMPSQVQGQAPQAARPGVQNSIPPQIINHVQSFEFLLPPNISPKSQEGMNKIKELKNSYAVALTKQSQAADNIKKIEAAREQFKQQGREFPTEYLQRLNDAQTTFQSSKAYVEDFRKKQAALKKHYQDQQQSHQAHQSQITSGGGSVAPPGVGDVQIKTEGGTSQPFSAMSQPSQGTASAPLMKEANTQNQLPRAAQNVTSIQTSQNHPQSRTGSLSGQPIMNTQAPNMRQPQAPGQQSSSMQSQHQTPVNQGPPGGQQFFTQQDAIAAAQAAAAASQQQPPQSARTTTPTHTPNFQNFPNGREGPQSAKMPIPKNLSVTAPQAVAMPPSRPTMGGLTTGGNASILQQPAIGRIPTYNLEGDITDRVLSKSKLNELVRQVTGGESSEMLTPEVEEVRNMSNIF